MATNYSNDVVRIFRDTEKLTAAKVLTAADSGKTLWLNAAAGKAVTLPALKDGINFKFVVAAAFATTNWIISSAEGDNIDGVLEVAGAVVAAAGEDQINFVANAETKGDFIQLECDGDTWFVSGQATAAGGITATDPS